MDQYEWLITRDDNKGMSRALIASFLFHALLFAVLVTTSIFYPAAGNAEKIDVLWQDLTATAHEPADAPDNPAQQENLVVNGDKSAVESEAEPSPPTQAEEADAQNREDSPPEPDPEPVVEQILPSPDESKEAARQAEEEIFAAERAERQRLKEEKSEREGREKAERERLAGEAAERESLAALKAERERLAQERAEEERAAAEAAERRQIAAEKAALEKREQDRLAEEAENQRLAALRAEEERISREMGERQRIAAENRDKERLTAEKAAREKAERERLAKEKAESKRLAEVKAKQERLAREKTERERIAAEKAERERLAAEKARQERMAKEKVERNRFAALKSEQERQAREKAERERLTAEKAERDRLAAEKAERERLAAENAERSRIAAKKAAIRKAEQEALALAAKTAAPIQRQESKVAVTQPNSVKSEPNGRKTAGSFSETKRMISFAMPGDLKLEITGDEEIRISVFFRAYPTAQRNRPMTKSEAKRGQNIIPLIARTGETTRVAVIETAAAGIYEFIAEPAGGKSTSAAFLLKLYEAGSKAKTKPCGRKTIAGKTVIVKVLMPEGILWDDESAFTGSMEDSDSVTKFNSDTGLLWKEYRE